MVPRNLISAEFPRFFQSLCKSNKKFRVNLTVIFALACLSLVPGQTNVLAQLPGMQGQTIDLDATAISSTQVRLAWRINRPNVIGSIRIYRAHTALPDYFAPLTALPATALSYVDSVAPGSTWIYRLQTTGRTPTQFSAPSNATRVTTPSNDLNNGASQQGNAQSPATTTLAPTLNNLIQTLTARAISSSEIELRWAVPVLYHVASLRIFRAAANEPKNFIYVGAIGAHQNRFVDANLRPRTTYHYFFRYNDHSNGARLSAPSNMAAASTPDGARPNPRAHFAHLRPAPGIPFELPSFGVAVPLDEREEELLYLINQYRAQHGLGPVRPSLALCQASDSLSKELAAKDELVRFELGASNTGRRVRAAGYLHDTKLDTITGLNRMEQDFGGLEFFFGQLKSLNNENSILLDPAWKVIGIGRNRAEQHAAWYWVFDFAAYWDKTIPLAGEDTDGRIDGNEGVRTRPPADALAANARFTGYGDDGRPYAPVHCDVETNECWRDPMLLDNRSLRELSLPENMISTWRTQYQVSARGVVHFNDPDKFDTTQFAMTLVINNDGTWSAYGYRAEQAPPPPETGTWSSVHDAARNEEIVTFTRATGKPAAVIRVHAARGLMRFYAVDGGSEMGGFFKGVPANGLRKDDPQVVFTPGPALLVAPRTCGADGSLCQVIGGAN